jgi:hypothetical protein
MNAEEGGIGGRTPGDELTDKSKLKTGIKLLVIYIIKLSFWLSGALLQVADDCRRLSCCCPTG